jgi:MFS transporter, ACS family, hexuronate transporter
MSSDAMLIEKRSFYDRNWRWWVLATLFLATFLNYMDRQTLSNAADPICKEFSLSNIERGQLLAAFVYSYAISHLFIGFLLDRVQNVRWLFPVFVVGWSLCNMAVGVAHDYTSILWLRYLLGVCESANFPLCLLIIAKTFPPRERAFASGVFYSGAVLATLAAPKIVIYFSTHYNWRWSFVVTGALGFVWLLPWLLVFRRAAERAAGWAAPAIVDQHNTDTKVGLAQILARPGFWGVVLAGMGIIPGLYFMSQWLPSYLRQAWKMPYDQALGNRLALVYVCQDLGMWLGGAMVWALAAAGLSTLASRKTVIVIAYVLMMGIMLLPQVASINIGIALLCAYVFGLGAWLANQQTFKQDVARGRVATVAALVGFAESIASAIVVEKVGQIGYQAAFLLFGAMFTFSLVVVLFFLPARWLQTE